MTFFNVDHNQAGSNNFAPIDEGDYEAIISDAEVTRSKTSSNRMIKMTITIRSDVEQKFGKRKLFENLVETEKAMFRFQQVAKAIGMQQGASVATLEDFAKAIKFKAVRITVKHSIEIYQGKQQIRDNIVFIDVATVPYNESGTSSPFAVPGAATPPMPTPPLPTDADAPPSQPAPPSTSPPWMS